MKQNDRTDALLRGNAWRTAFLAALLLCLCAGAFAEDAEALYVENEWNYVDGSMDISGGIPADAEGVLGAIREAGVLRVGTEPYFPPQEFIDENLSGQDRYVGSDMELARRVAERMGVELEIIPMEFTDLLDAVAEGKCDLVISALSYTPGRAVAVEFSKGYYFAGYDYGSGVLIRSEDQEEIAGVDDLADRTIVAQRGSVQEALAAENIMLYLEFRRLASVQQLYDAVAGGRADAAVVDYQTAQTYVKNNPDAGLMLLPDVYFLLEEQFKGDRIAAKRGELQLIYFVNGVIDEVTAEGQYQKWFDEYDDYATNQGT